LVKLLKPMGIERSTLGSLPDGHSVDLYTLSSGGIEISATNYSGIIISIRVPGAGARAGLSLKWF
jgi:hypothetical protein